MTCAFVTTSPRLTTQPEPSTPEAAGDSRHAHDALRRAHDVRILREPLLGRRDDRRRTEEHADRIDALELLEQPFRREHVVDLGENRRALDGAAELGLARDVQEHRTDRPAQEDARDEPEHEPGETVEKAHPRNHADARAEHSGEHAPRGRA